MQVEKGKKKKERNINEVHQNFSTVTSRDTSRARIET
jgi:hypothetical protein